MGGILDILNISVGTLLNQQMAMETTSHNIANISTPNYARQRVVQETRYPFYTRAGALGRGAQISNIEQVRDKFVDRLFLEKNSSYNYYVADNGIMTKIESMLNETENYGLSHNLQEFWNSWQDLARNPSGSAERQVIVEKASALADKIRNIYTGYEDIKDGIDQKISDGVSVVNTTLEKIAGLNTEIARLEVTGHPANDLRDQRQQALEDLSEYGDFKYSEQTDGSVTVEFYTDYTGGTKVTMVQNGDYGSITTPASGSAPVFAGQDSSGTAFTDLDLQAGKLAGWKERWNTITNTYEDSLNDLALNLATKVNTIHNLGPNAVDIFVQSGGGAVDASGITVNSSITSNPDLINSGYSANPGDNSLALDMANAGNDTIVGLGGKSINDYWQNFVSGLGTEANGIEAKMDFQQALKNELRGEQQSVSGVSLEEEMVNMIQYQHIYQAAARMISTGKEMLDTLINMT